MDTKSILPKVSEAKKASKKRKFKQTVDFIIALKELNLKNPEEQLDFYVGLPFPTGRKKKVCALVGLELKPKAEGVFDLVLQESQFDSFKEDKKKLKKIIKEYDYFVAQANLMAKVAGSLGKFLGPKGKMPNPKAGCVVDMKTDLKATYEKLQNLVRVSAKSQAQVQAAVGTEDTDDLQIAENCHSIYDQVLHHLPKGELNIRKVLVKLTMGPAIEVE